MVQWSAGIASSRPNGVEKRAASARTALCLDLRNCVRMIVRSGSQNLQIREDRAQGCRITAIAVDQFSGKLCLHEGMGPLAAGPRPNASSDERGNRRLERRIVRPVCAIAEPPIGALALGACQAIGGFAEVRIRNLILAHDAMIASGLLFWRSG